MAIMAICNTVAYIFLFTQMMRLAVGNHLESFLRVDSSKIRTFSGGFRFDFVGGGDIKGVAGCQIE